MSRQYPQRGDLIRVVEGGKVYLPLLKADGTYGFSATMIPVLVGATLTCQGIAWENESDEFYRTNKPTVWIHSKSLGTCYVHPNSWYPVEGPPVEAVLTQGDNA